jgi:uncharacterized protein with von Willebrand factor type A (vWA) domain
MAHPQDLQSRSYAVLVAGSYSQGVMNARWVPTKACSLSSELDCSRVEDRAA